MEELTLPWCAVSQLTVLSAHHPGMDPALSYLGGFEEGEGELPSPAPEGRQGEQISQPLLPTLSPTPKEAVHQSLFHMHMYVLVFN